MLTTLPRSNSLVGFGRAENAAQSLVEMFHRVRRIVGAHVDDRVFALGSFFQHVCGNSEPVSAE